MGYVFLAVLVACVVVVLIKVRPKLRERRYQAWREAGLLPEQLDREPPAPDAPGGR